MGALVTLTIAASITLFARDDDDDDDERELSEDTRDCIRERECSSPTPRTSPSPSPSRSPSPAPSRSPSPSPLRSSPPSPITIQTPSPTIRVPSPSPSVRPNPSQPPSQLSNDPDQDTNNNYGGPQEIQYNYDPDYSSDYETDYDTYENLSYSDEPLEEIPETNSSESLPQSPVNSATPAPEAPARASPSVKLSPSAASPQEVSCPGDFNGDGRISFSDVFDLIANSRIPQIKYDLNRNAQVNFKDLLIELLNLGKKC